MKAKIMKTKEEILKEAYLDIMYTTKNSKEILENVYEYGFANGFKQGNDNAREVADFEKKKKALQNLNMTREEVQGPPQEEKQVSLTHEPPFDENPSDREIIEALILHLNEQDGFLTAINCVSTKAILSWLKKQKEQKPAECLKDTLIEWANFVLKCQEEELAKYDGPSYMKASTMGRIDAYKVLIAKLNSL